MTLVTPADEKVLIKVSMEEEKTASGLVIPDTIKERPSEGVVMAIGRGRFVDGEYQEPFFKIGDRVFIGKAQGICVRSDKTDQYEIYPFNQIQAVVED